MNKQLKLLLLALLLFASTIIIYIVYRYPYLLKAKSFFEENPYTYFFEDHYRFFDEFEHFNITHYSSYKNNVSLMSDTTTSKCPFFYTPNEPNNKDIIFADNHILWENQEPLHTNLRNYAQALIPDSVETIKRLEEWFKSTLIKEISPIDFEKIVYYTLFKEKLTTKDAELVINFRALTREVALLPPFIRKIFMNGTLKEIQKIKLYFENKFASDGHPYPQLVFEMFWFNQAPLYQYYIRSLDLLNSDTELLLEVKNNSKIHELIQEIFRLYPAVRLIPYNVAEEYYAANISLANIDSTEFKNPFKIDVNRTHYNHLTFATPSKRGCVGRDLTTNILTFLIQKEIKESSI